MNSLLVLAIVLAPTLHFFYTPDCGHCMDILLSDIPELQGKYTFVFNGYDINDMDNFRQLEQMEQEYGTTGEDLPIVFMGDSVIYGPEETRARLEQVIKHYTESAMPPDTTKPPPDTVKLSPDTTARPKGPRIHLYYFTHTHCRECGRTDVLVSNIEKYYENVKVHTYDLAGDSAKLFYEAIARYAAIPEERRLIAPAMVIDTIHIMKEEITLANLDSLFAMYRGGSPMLDTLDLANATQNLIERFSRFSIFGIMIAGLLDGVNPCAFATLVFFVSYLLFIGRRRRDVIFMAVAFIGAVFLAYLGIGFGAFGLMTLLARIDIIARILFFVFGVIALILGILSLRDWLLARRGETGKMMLQLPLGIKQRIHKSIKERTSSGRIIAGAFVAGFFVSFLEFGCTGQVYLPTITFMVSQAGFETRSFLALVLYNVMFVLPLVVIAVLATAISQKKVASFMETRIATVKFLTALLFFGLGVLLILSAW